MQLILILCQYFLYCKAAQYDSVRRKWKKDYILRSQFLSFYVRSVFFTAYETVKITKTKPTRWCRKPASLGDGEEGKENLFGDSGKADFLCPSGHVLRRQIISSLVVWKTCSEPKPFTWYCTRGSFQLSANVYLRLVYDRLLWCYPYFCFLEASPNNTVHLTNGFRFAFCTCTVVKMLLSRWNGSTVCVLWRTQSPQCTHLNRRVCAHHKS